MPSSRLILNMTRINRNLPCLLLRSLINILVRHILRPSKLTQNFGYTLCQRGLTVIDVSDGTDVDMRFGAFVVGGEAS